MESVYKDTEDYRLKPEDFEKIMQDANTLFQEIQATLQRQSQNQNGTNQ